MQVGIPLLVLALIGLDWVKYCQNSCSNQVNGHSGLADLQTVVLLICQNQKYFDLTTSDCALVVYLLALLKSLWLVLSGFDYSVVLTTSSIACNLPWVDMVQLYHVLILQYLMW